MMSIYEGAKPPIGLNKENHGKIPAGEMRKFYLNKKRNSNSSQRDAGMVRLWLLKVLQPSTGNTFVD